VLVAEPDRRTPESRRTFPRIPCRVLVDYVVDGLAYRDCIANISEGGAFIETSNTLDTGSPVTLSFSLFQDQQPVKVVGTVAWAGPTGVGVRFHPNQTISQFCLQRDDTPTPPPPKAEPPRAHVPEPWGRRATDLPAHRVSRRAAATAPLWVALSLVIVLALVSRYETNARIDAVADKVDRAAQSLVQLQSLAMSRDAESRATTPVQTTFAPASRAPSPTPETVPARVDPRPVQAVVPVMPPVPPAPARAAQRAPEVTVPVSAQVPQRQAPDERVAAADAAPAPDTIYVVQVGDNLYRISEKFNVSQTALMEHNGLSQPNRILVGQRIRIPAAAAR